MTDINNIGLLGMSEEAKAKAAEQYRDLETEAWCHPDGEVRSRAQKRLAGHVPELDPMVEDSGRS